MTAANAAVAMMGVTTYQKEDINDSMKKARSAIVVSTAWDLNQIVTHSKNLWMKYNAIAKEHNQKVNWITVAKELGIHVKVREKYARMHARALHRGFDFDKCGHYRIKQHPEIFLEPLTPEQKSELEPQSQDPNSSVVMVHCPKEISHPVSTISDDQVAAAVDAAIKTVPVPQTVADFNDTSAAATAVDAAMNAAAVDAAIKTVSVPQTVAGFHDTSAAAAATAVNAVMNAGSTAATAVDAAMNAAAVDAAIKTVSVPQTIAGFYDTSTAVTAVDAVMKRNDDCNGDTVEHPIDISVADAATVALAAAPDQDSIHT